MNGGGFDMMAGEPYAPGGVVLVPPDGTTRQVADGLAFPNGMAVTGDNQTLIVGESYARRLTVYEIAGDGTLTNGRVWAELGDGVPDGICIDVEGAVWYADVPNKRCVRVHEGGELLDTVELDRGGFACALGGAERKMLYILATEWNGPENMSKAREPDSYSRSQRPRQRQVGRGDEDLQSRPTRETGWGSGSHNRLDQRSALRRLSSSARSTALLLSSIACSYARAARGCRLRGGAARRGLRTAAGSARGSSRRAAARAAPGRRRARRRGRRRPPG